MLGFVIVWLPSNREDFLPPDLGSVWKLGQKVLSQGQDLGIVLGKQGIFDDRSTVGGKLLPFLITYDLTRPFSLPLASHVGLANVEDVDNNFSCCKSYSTIQRVDAGGTDFFESVIDLILLSMAPPNSEYLTYWPILM